MRKRMSRLLAAALCGSMVLAGCSGSGAGTGETTQTKDSEEGKAENVSVAEADPDKTYDISYTGYWCFSDYEDGSYIEKMIEDALNVNITVEKAETADTIDLLLASGEMPDCMWADTKTVSWMKDQELIRTIPRAMVERYCPKLIEIYEEYPLIYKQVLNPQNEDEFDYLSGVTFQFVDYYLPGDFYRYDWIENLGIDLGVNVEQVADRLYVADDGIELSKFIEIMDGFVNGDPNQTGKNDTVGATAPALDVGQFYSAYGFGRDINDVDGKAVQSYATENYKNFLKGFAELYKKNLIDPEIITGDRTLSWDKVNTGVAGYWITSTNALNTWAVDRPPLTIMERDPNAKILVTPGIKPDGGEVMATTNPSPAYGNFYVNANVDDEKLAKILQFLNYTLFGDGEKDTVPSLFFGEKGVDWEWDAAGEMPVKLNSLNSGDKGTWTFSQFGQTKEVTKWVGEEPLFQAGAKYWSAGSDGIWMKWQHRPYKADLASETEFENVKQEISSDLDAYVANYRTQAIMGKVDVDTTWDSYLTELDRLGYNRMMDELDKIDSLDEMIASFAD